MEDSMAVDTGIDMSDLEGKSVEELEALGVSMTAIKEEFMRDWEKGARIIQDELAEAQAREYAIRNSDPAYQRKLQGSTPDFVTVRKTRLDSMIAERAKLETAEEVIAEQSSDVPLKR
jgi:hypothetical protein